MKSLRAYVLKNSRSSLTKRLEGILYLLENGKYKELLDPSGHEYAWRFIDADTVSKMGSILKLALLPSRSTTLSAGTLYPDDRNLSSWTVNPRSLVYSGFFSVIPPNSHMVLVRAEISKNRFFGNPDEMVTALDLPSDYSSVGYALEREVVAVGPVDYVDGVFQQRDSSRSLEGQAMDMINHMDPLSDKDEDDWSQSYYLPKV